MRPAEPRDPHPVDVDVGQRLRAARRRAGLSQNQLGDALGITFQQIQKYERGANRVSASMLVMAAQTLGVPAAHLLPPEPDASRMSRLLDPQIEKLIEVFEHLPVQTRRAVLDLATSLSRTHGATPVKSAIEEAA